MLYSVSQKKLGSGSQGSVYKAKHRKSDFTCAIKKVLKSELESEIKKEQMKRELEVLEEIVHPHITRVLELLEDAKSFYIVMEFVEDGDLMNLIDSDYFLKTRNSARVIF